MTNRLSLVAAVMIVAVLAAFTGLAPDHITGLHQHLVFSAPLLMGALVNVSNDNNTSGGTSTVVQQYNKLAAWTRYITRNRLISTVVASLPAVATAGTKSKVKTANATVVLNAGVANALAATDNLWTLTGADLAAGMFRKYLLLVDSADTATVQASNDAATAAACLFATLPADGLAIAGVLTVATDATHTFTPGTTLLDAAGITATYADGHTAEDGVLPFGNIIPT